MKIKNVRIVAEIKVTAPSVAGTEQTYKKCRDNRGGLMSGWADWDYIPEFVSKKIRGDRYPVDFTVSIAGYEPASSLPRRGMDRRHALGVLKRLGLRAPSIAQTMVLASQVIRVNEVILSIMKANDNRRVACVVPFNPEAPSYYYFGMGIKGLGSFSHVSYETIREEDNLYFWHHTYAHDQGDEYTPDLFQYHFPLLLGVRYSI